MKTLKRIAAVAATAALTVAMSVSCFAATWHSYFGASETWFEGAEGKLTSNTETGWVADMTAIGWGGCWGGQVDQKITIKKGEKYTLKCTLSSSNCDKWVFIKISKGDNFAYGKWVHLKKGGSETVNETFEAQNDADQITFGIGGDFGDRTGIDADAEKRYAYTSEKIDDVDATFATKITCKDFSLASAETATEAATTAGGGGTTTTTTTPNGTTTTVATGDFTPIACGAAAVVAAAVIVVFARKKETE